MLRIKLKELLFLRGISEKELSLLTKIDVKIIKKYCDNEIRILRSETLK